MDISRRQWFVALAVATGLHLLVLAAVHWSGPPATPPTDSPKGVMITLDNLDSGPPPPTSIDDLPIESLSENAEIGPPDATTADTPVSDTAPVAANEAISANPPPAAAPIGPAPALDAAEPVISDTPPAAIANAGSGPEANPQNIAPNSARTPAITAAVSVRPDTTLDARQPDQEVTARDATQPDTSASTPHNGAYGSSEQATNDYVATLRAWLSRHKRYPEQARAAGRTGTVKLYIVVDASGHVLEHRIAQSSGIAALDQAANNMLARSEPLPAMPSATDRNRLELVIPIVFTLH
ncbi:MAG: energy transducer TonB [Salinisphaera sp.]|jgi:protein TonB|nr:energy transducer TonB [Salinisphaera sp.]